jgi:MFS family permease
MVGPVIGGLIYGFFSYFMCFIVFTCIIAFTGLVCIFALPSSLNRRVLEEMDANVKANRKSNIEPSYKWFFLNRRAIFAFLSTTAVCMFISFQSSFMTVVFLDDWGIPEYYHGLITAIPALTYVLSAFIVGYIIDLAPRRIFMSITFIFMAISIFLMGPSEIFGLSSI